MHHLSIAATITMNQPSQRPQQRQLEAVLHDPDASWSEIREAMKSSRGCTNNAIMGAIASGRGVAVPGHTNGSSNGNGDKEKLTDSDVAVGAAEASALNSNTPNQKVKVNEKTTSSSSCEHDHKDENEFLHEEIIETLHIPLKDISSDNNNASADSQEDLTNSRNRRPSRRGMHKRGGSFRSSKTKNRWGQIRSGHFNSSMASQASSNASVNMMDFGVDNNVGMSTLNETSLFLDGLRNSRRGSMSSCSASFNDSNGFLGWSHNDGVESLMSSTRSTYSDLVDSDGFLGWDKNKGCQSPSADKPIPVGKVIEGFTSGFGGSASRLKSTITGSFSNNSDDSEQKDNSRVCRPKEPSWNIEDYENPSDNVMRTGQRGFFANQMRRLSCNDLHNMKASSTTTTTNKSGTGQLKEEINMKDIKDALIKVAKSADFPEVRRRTLDDDLSGDAATVKEKMTTKPASSKPKGPRRRKTIMEMPSFFRTSEPAALHDDDEDDGGYGSMDDVICYNRSSDASENQGPSYRHRSTFPGSNLNILDLSSRSGGLASPGIVQEANMWQTGPKSNSIEDLREAIWINRKDGDVDIDKECRKLYRTMDSGGGSGSDGNVQQRRASLLGLETSMFASKANDDWFETTSIH